MPTFGTASCRWVLDQRENLSQRLKTRGPQLPTIKAIGRNPRRGPVEIAISLGSNSAG
ncbi:hypothetical protein QA641_04175 [Bradyrhizobium sp. CB1650]|uniref:hypothetical protein n=1 Tax=Bradyrhizobium sp. CB1650 TaxID=3039153 RepID=UPI0024355F5F|nr:hypothetical protein [Bradyrhizobium sp. CB1650]WGD53139.1 hypothetical protein QA641_04175 [Bradyrhizobium sp. CB1650]